MLCFDRCRMAYERFKNPAATHCSRRVLLYHGELLDASGAAGNRAFLSVETVLGLASRFARWTGGAPVVTWGLLT